MKCKCGADMRQQSQGVWFCSKGDYFAVALFASKDPEAPNVQWYARVGELERWESFNYKSRRACMSCRPRIRHWFTVRGKVGVPSPTCVQCGVLNPKFKKEKVE